MSIIRTGCFMLLCKCLGKSKESLLVCHPLTHPHHPLTLQWTGLKSKRQSAAFACLHLTLCQLAVHPGTAGQAQPLLSPKLWPGAVSVGQTAAASSRGTRAHWEAARTGAHPSVHPEGSKVPSCFALCTLTGMASVSVRSFILVLPWQNPCNFQLIK